MAYKNERERRREVWEKNKWEDSHNMVKIRKRRKILFAIAVTILLCAFFLSLANPLFWITFAAFLILPFLARGDK